MTRLNRTQWLWGDIRFFATTLFRRKFRWQAIAEMNWTQRRAAFWWPRETWALTRLSHAFWHEEIEREEAERCLVEKQERNHE